LQRSRAAERIQQPKRTHPIRLIDSYLCGNKATHGISADVRALNPEGIQKPNDVRGLAWNVMTETSIARCTPKAR